MGSVSSTLLSLCDPRVFGVLAVFSLASVWKSYSPIRPAGDASDWLCRSVAFDRAGAENGSTARTPKMTGTPKSEVEKREWVASLQPSSLFATLASLASSRSFLWPPFGNRTRLSGPRAMRRVGHVAPGAFDRAGAENGSTARAPKTTGTPKSEVEKREWVASLQPSSLFVTLASLASSRSFLWPPFGNRTRLSGPRAMRRTGYVAPGAFDRAGAENGSTARTPKMTGTPKSEVEKREWVASLQPSSLFVTLASLASSWSFLWPPFGNRTRLSGPRAMRRTGYVAPGAFDRAGAENGSTARTPKMTGTPKSEVEKPRMGSVSSTLLSLCDPRVLASSRSFLCPVWKSHSPIRPAGDASGWPCRSRRVRSRGAENGSTARTPKMTGTPNWRWRSENGQRLFNPPLSLRPSRLWRPRGCSVLYALLRHRIHVFHAREWPLAHGGLHVALPVAVSIERMEAQVI